MSYNGSKDRFGYQARKAIENEFVAIDEAKAMVVSDCMLRINNAEDDIRRAADRIRGRVDTVMQDLNAGLHIHQPGLESNAVEMARAIAARDIYFSMLVGLLGQEKVQAMLASQGE